MSLILFAIANLTLSGAFGQAFKYSREDSHKDLINRNKVESEKRFERLVAAYQQHVDDNPSDTVAATEMCRFIRYYTYQDAAFYENAEKYLQQAEQHLKSTFKNEPVVELYFFDQLYDEDMIDRASRLIDSEKIKWSKSQLASIYLEVAIFYEREGDKKKAGENAINSLELYPTTKAQLIAGDYFYSAKLFQRGIEVLTSEYPREFPNQKKRRMQLLSELGAHDKALNLLEKLRTQNPNAVSPIEETKIWIRNQSIDRARQVFVSAKWKYWDKVRLAKAYFSFEKQYGNSIQSLNAYNYLRDQGFFKDPLLYHRLSLALKHPLLPWENRDGLGALFLLGIVLTAFALPLVILVPVHYWGLLRQRAGKLNQHQLQPNWSLRDAWILSAFFLFIFRFFITYLFAYEEIFQPIFDQSTNSQALQIPDLRLAWIVLTSDMILALSLFWILKPSRVVQSYSPAKWSLWLSVQWAVAGWVFLFVFSKVLSFANHSADVTLTDRSLYAVLDIYGPFTLILAVAILTPIIEEVLFRGVLLGALVKYIPFWVANTIQASLFMVAHENTSYALFYFAFGLICGVYRQRSGNLVACTLLHCSHNGFVALLMIWASS